MKIRLRKFNILDYFKFLKLTLNPETSKEFDKTFFGYIYQGIKNLFVKNNSYTFAILVNKKFIGSIAIYKEEKNYEIGYFIIPEYRKKGIAKKAVKEILNYSFNYLKLKKIIASTEINNKPSIKVLKDSGFKITKRNKKENELIFEKLK